MSIDLEPDEVQVAIADTIARFCDRRFAAKDGASGPPPFDATLWRDLAELGVLAAGTPEGVGGPAEVAVAMEALGARLFPGPLAATVLATQLLGPDERGAVCAGHAIATVGGPELFPHGAAASVFLAFEGDAVIRVRPTGSVCPVPALDGEPWGRAAVETVERFPDATAAIALYRVALAALLLGAGDGLLRAAAAYAATRKQFGQPIGNFQAVAHPLADCRIRIDAARLLVASAAERVHDGAPDASRESAIAHFSARRAATDTAHACHQVFGAVGITREGPAFGFSRRIMGLAAWPAGPGSAPAALAGPGSDAREART